ncbi:M48 metallopeptidase family protein [Rothia sp. 11273D007AR]
MAISREILPATASRPEIEVVRSTRRTRTVQLAPPNQGGRLRLMVPATSTDREIEDYLRRMLPKVEARRARKDAGAQRGALDEFLRERADYLRATYLPEAPEPLSIRWVTNQKQRWASATPAERTIRISHTLQGAPEYALDSVIFHELCHFLESNHSPAFRALEARYPHLEKARGFLEGVTFGQRAQQAGRA